MDISILDTQNSHRTSDASDTTINDAANESLTDTSSGKRSRQNDTSLSSPTSPVSKRSKRSSET
ncbi:hypothetical protein PUN28_013728 [Cardiocondyla obscurior]